MRYRLCCLAFLALTLLPTLAPSQDSSPTSAAGSSPQSASNSLDQVIDRFMDREHFLVSQLKGLHPVAETYIQNLEDNHEADPPRSDQYFLGQLDMSRGPDDHRFRSKPDTGFFHPFPKLASVYHMKLLPRGFVQMAILDEDLQRQNYDFAFVRREFLGEVRCLVLDVNPKPHTGKGRFKGRIWVEDQDYNIVRFNGTFYPHPRNRYYLH